MGLSQGQVQKAGGPLRETGPRISLPFPLLRVLIISFLQFPLIFPSASILSLSDISLSLLYVHSRKWSPWVTSSSANRNNPKSPWPNANIPEISWVSPSLGQMPTHSDGQKQPGKAPWGNHLKRSDEQSGIWVICPYKYPRTALLSSHHPSCNPSFPCRHVGKAPSSLYMTRLPWCLSGKESTCQWRSRRRLKFHPRVREIPWRRKRQPTPVFLPGKSHWQGSLAGYRSKRCKESGTTEVTEHLTPSTSLYMRCPLSRNALRFNARQHRNSPWRLLLYLFSSSKGWKVKDEKNWAWPQWVIIRRRTTSM